MEIQYFGLSCFRLRGKKAVLLTDPFSPKEVGLKFPKVSSEIITISHQRPDNNNISGVLGTKNRIEPFVVDGPGEYEVSGVMIFGIGDKKGRNTIYAIEMDDLRLVHLGDLGHTLDEAQLEEINGADVLFVPVGVPQVVAQVEPKIVIPMHYKIPGLTFDLDPLGDFLKQMGVEQTEPQSKLTIIKEKLPEERETIVLQVK